jgi:hypothetical protein
MPFATLKNQNTDGLKQSLNVAYVILSEKSIDDDDFTTYVLGPMCAVGIILRLLSGLARVKMIRYHNSTNS